MKRLTTSFVSSSLLFRFIPVSSVGFILEHDENLEPDFCVEPEPEKSITYSAHLKILLSFFLNL